MQLLGFVLALLASGVVAGLLAGLLGVGGGIVIVPMLYHVFRAYGVDADVAMPLAVGTSLSTIVLTSLISARNHHVRGSVDWALAHAWLGPVLLGVALGIAAAQFVPAAGLRIGFGGLAMLVALHMLVTAQHALSPFNDLPAVAVQRLLGIAVGAVSSLLGIGGGTMMVPLLSLFSYPIRRAVATAAVFGFVIAVPATMGYLIAGWDRAGLPPGSTGYVNWLAFATLVPATMLLAPVGVRLAYRIRVTQLKRVFALFLFAVGVKMMFF